MTEAATVRQPEPPALDREVSVVGALSGLLAFAALVYCSQHDLLLLYGDAVAHLHIARRVLDSLNPGFRQLGSVWLPLPHLLLLPFVQKMSWWQSGLAGAIPSMACYVAGCVGLYRLARMWLARSASAGAVLFYGLNPGLLYMQTTAMTEPLFLAEMIWAALLVAEIGRALDKGEQERASRRLPVAGLILLAAVYTRYDGWIYAACAWLVLVFHIARSGRWRERAGGAFLFFTVLLLVAPLLWMAYNSKQFHDPLDFLRGPYSAKAIEQRTASPGMPHYPGWHSTRVSAIYFLKAAELGAAPLAWTNRLLLAATVGTLLAVAKWIRTGSGAALLLWMPLPFYAYSIAYGSVPIFIPLWWPHSWYNTRYGMELLPAFAFFLAALAGEVASAVDALRPRTGRWIIVVFMVLIVMDGLALLRSTPLVFQEALANSKTRIPFEHALAGALLRLPPNSAIMMYTSEHIGAVQQAGIPLKDTVNETDDQVWRAALQAPAKAAPSVIAIAGDPVSKAIELHPEGLTLNEVVCSTGQPCARIYSSKNAQ